MDVHEHLADSWGALIALLAGGLTWAVIPNSGLAIPLGLGVAVVVFGTKVAMGMLMDRGHRTREPALGTPRVVISRAGLPAAPPGSPARGWLLRAERAVGILDELVDSAGGEVTAQRLETVRDGARGTAAALGRLAGQVTAFDQALARIDADQLSIEHQRLATQLAGARTDELRTERRQAMDSLQQQLEVHQRLSSGRDKLLAQMQATALGLEGLGARAAELVALSAAAGSTGTAEDLMLDELTADLDAMRAGLAEVDSLSQRLPGLP